MPANTHLEWVELRDFTAGLWTVGDWLMPPTALQQMDDCYPITGGGVRAWFKPTAISTTGLTAPASEVVLGFHARNGVALRAGIGLSFDRYLTTFHAGDLKTRLYRMDGTALATTWSLIFTSVAGSTAIQTCWSDYQLTAGNFHVIFSLQDGAADAGTYSIDYTSGAVTRISLTAGPNTVHASRLVVGNAASGKVIFTGPGDETFGTNSISIEPSRQIDFVAWLQSFSPGDLLVGTMGAPFYLIEGDLTDFTLRQMADDRTIEIQQDVHMGPEGVIYVALNDGLYTTPDGMTHISLSPSIPGTTWQQGLACFVRHWVATNNSGLVMDYVTRAMFKSTFMATSAVTALERAHGDLVTVTSGFTFSISQFDTSEDTAHRAEDFTLKTAPLRDQTGRQIEVREVQVAVKPYNGATSSLTVTVNGTARTVSCDATRGYMSFLFKERAENLDITVRSRSNATGVEAPSIEAVRVGSQPGHQVN